MPFELGPIFRFETRRLVARTAWYFLRVLLVIILTALFVNAQALYSSMVSFGQSSWAALSLVADFCSGLYGATGLVLAFVIAPLAAVGSFNGSRGKHMLPLLLVTRLSGRQVVWQSFAAGLVPGATMWLCMLPFASFLVSWWGVDPAYVAIAAAVSLMSMLACVASAVAFSLWLNGLFSTIVAVYSLWLGWLVATSMQISPGVFPSWAPMVNSFVLVLPASRGISPSTTVNAAYFVGGAAVFTVALLELAAATFRRCVLARQNKGTSRMGRTLAGLSQALSCRPGGFRVPTLDGNPILWREWRHARAALGVQAFWACYVLGAAITTVIGARAYWAGPTAQPLLAGAAGYELGIGVLALAIQASLVWSEEKSDGRKGIDLLLATPLSAATIVNGKWRGVYRFNVPVVAFPLISSLIVLGDAPRLPTFEPETFSAFTALSMVGLVLAQALLYAAAFVSLGILLATRCAKPYHALFWTIGLYVGVALFVPTVAEIMFLGTNRPLAMGLAMGSPVAAPIAVIMTRFPGPYFGPAEFAFPYASIWLVVAAGAAWVLHWSTIQQFDRRMERSPARGRRSGFAVDLARLALESGRPARALRSARE
jgi:hypothetical protein